MHAFISTSALILYPVVIHLSILFDKSLWAFWYMLLVSVWIAFESLSWFWRMSVAVLLVGLLTLIDTHVLVKGALYTFPVFICLAFFLLFARSLGVGKIPLITSVARMAEGSLSDSAETYTRQLTWFWSFVFLLLVLETILLAVFAPIEVWSLFTNVINYIVVIMIFILEYFVRKRVLHEWRDRSFRQFLGSLAKVRLRNNG